MEELTSAENNSFEDNHYDGWLAGPHQREDDLFAAGNDIGLAGRWDASSYPFPVLQLDQVLEGAKTSDDKSSVISIVVDPSRKLNAESDFSATNLHERADDEIAEVPPVMTDGEVPGDLQTRRKLVRLQCLIIAFANRLEFAGPTERQDFVTRVKSDLGNTGEGDLKESRFGTASREGYRKYCDFLCNEQIPETLARLKQLGVNPPVGLQDLKVIGSTQLTPRTVEQLLQEVSQKRVYLDIDSNNLQDLEKLDRVEDWLTRSNRLIMDERMERLEKHLSKTLESGIARGLYSKTWRRSDGMDKTGWCSAVEQTMAVYDRVTKLIELLDYIERRKKGFNNDGLKTGVIPAGIEIHRDEHGDITAITFGTLLTDGLTMEGERNKGKLDLLNEWCERCEKEATGAREALLKDMTHIAGYGEVPLKDGWIASAARSGSKTSERDWIFQAKVPPEGNWQSFNVLKFDMDVEHILDGYGRLVSVNLTSSTDFRSVPPYGYLNLVYDSIFTQKSKKNQYKPNDWVAVQVDPSKVELIQAKDLKSWRDRQQIKELGANAITITMDAAMVVSGTIELRAAIKVGELAARELVHAGGLRMSTEVAAKLPTYAIAKNLSKGTFDVVLGGTGIFHNAGAQEVPLLNDVSVARSAYFLGHASYSLLKIAGTVPGMFIPRADYFPAKELNGFKIQGLTSLHVAETGEPALHLARAKAFEEFGLPTKIAESVSRKSFSVSENAFVGMFLWEIVDLANKSGNRRTAHFELLSFGDTSGQLSVEQLGKFRQQNSYLLEDLKSFAGTLDTSKPEIRQQIDDIIKQTAQLLKPNVSHEQRAQYRAELMRYLRFSGPEIAALQDGREKPFSSDELETMAARGHNLDPALHKMAALALLLLSRDVDNSVPANLVSRSINVDRYRVLVTLATPDGGTYTAPEWRDGPAGEKQTITYREMLEILGSDYRAANDIGVKIAKARGLQDAGVLSTEAFADLLLNRISSPRVNDGDKITAVLELCSIVSKIKMGEVMRAGSYDSQPVYIAKGLAFGLSSAEISDRLYKIVAQLENPRLKCTVLLAAMLMNREKLDNVDMQRISKYFLSSPAGVTPEDFEQMLVSDLNLPVASNSSGKERALSAAEMILADPALKKKWFENAAHALESCMNGDTPAIAVRAFERMTAPGVNGDAMVDELHRTFPHRNWPMLLEKKAVELLRNMDCNRATDKDNLREIFHNKIRLMELASRYVYRPGSDPLWKDQLTALLLGCIDIGRGEPIDGGRIAALRALSRVQTGKDGASGAPLYIVNRIRNLTDPAVEPVALVRLEAINTIEKMIVIAADRKAVLGNKAAIEPDAAVQEKLLRWYEAQGTIKDTGSQRTAEKILNDRINQNKLNIKWSEVENLLAAQRLTKQPNIAGYLDFKSATVKIFGKETNIWEHWQTASRNTKSDDRVIAPYIDAIAQLQGQRETLVWELRAQAKAVEVYNKSINDLVDKTMNGSTDAITVMGSSNLNERQVAILMLCSLVSGGTRMGEPFYKHGFSPDAPQITAVDHRDFREADRLVREDAAGQFNIPLFKSDPWEKTETRLAERLKELCSQSNGDVDIKLLIDGILYALRGDASTSDKSRLILIEGLDQLMSKPNFNAELKRYIVRTCISYVSEWRDCRATKAEALTVLLELLDKRFPEVFEPLSEEHALLRCALRSRSTDREGTSLESVSTPPRVKLRADELLDRGWNSPLAEYRRQPGSSALATERIAMLPKDNPRVKAQYSAQGKDAAVHEFVQRMLSAAKGADIKDREWLDQIMVFTKVEYDDRVRLAACISLIESKVMSATSLHDTLQSLAINSNHRAVRGDAAELLKKSTGVVDEAVQTPALEAVLASVSRITGQNVDELRLLADDRLLSLANEAVNKGIASVNAHEKANAEVLLFALHKYAEITAILAANKLQKGEIAIPLIKNSLQALGIEPEQLDSIANEIEYFSWDNAVIETPACKAMLKKLLERQSHTGHCHALLNSLLLYSSAASSEIARDALAGRPPQRNEVNKILVLLKLFRAVADVYQSEGTIDRANSYDGIAKVLQNLGSARMAKGKEHTWLQFGREATQWQGKAVEQIKKFQVREPDNLNVDAWISQLSLRRIQSCTELYRQAIAVSPPLSKSNLDSYAAAVDESLLQHPPSATFEIAALACTKSWLDVDCASPGERIALSEKASEHLAKVLLLAKTQYGVKSKQYQTWLEAMCKLYEANKQPEKAVDYFRHALSESREDTETAILLRHYASFLRKTGCISEALEKEQELKRIEAK